MTNRILLLKRTNNIFIRPMTLANLDGKFITSIEKPKNMVICDGCGNLITTELIKCLSFKKGYIHSAQCDKCVKEYFSNFKTVKEHEFNE